MEIADSTPHTVITSAQVHKENDSLEKS